MNIAFVSSDWGRTAAGTEPSPGGAGWVRIHQPALALAQYGEHRTVIGHGIGGRADGRLIPLDFHSQPLMLDPDLIVVQRWMNAEAPQAITDARRAGQVIIQDVDDWFWGLHPANRAHRTTNKRLNPDHNREHYKAVIERSDAVTCSTGFLAKRIRDRMGARTFILRNCINPSLFTKQPIRNISEGLVVGWTGALQWRSGDLETLRGWFGDWLATNDATFVHHGVFPGEPDDLAASIIGLAPEQVGPSKRGVPPADYPDNVAGFDIGIVPLSDHPFNHAKSWIKGLEYAAAGIPFVAFGTSEYEQLGCGLTATTPDEWVAALDALRSPTLRAEQAALGRAVAREWSFRHKWSEWASVYHAVLGH